MSDPNTPKVLNKFDPTQHMTKVSGRDYLEVKWRLVWFRSEHRDATITTDMTFNDGDQAIFIARIEIPGGGVATGWGSCTASSFGEYIEKAETKAIGRALAALGFGTQFTYDFEDGPEVGTYSDSPVHRPTPQSRQQYPQRSAQGGQAQRSGVYTGGGPQPVSERQDSLIRTLAAQARLSGAFLDDFIRDKIGCEPEQLNRAKASSLIDALKEQIERNKQSRPQGAEEQATQEYQRSNTYDPQLNDVPF